MVTSQEEAKKLANALGLSIPLYLKREDLHPYGSHKGRSIPVMIEKYIQEGWYNFCISSSGNAALAAAMFIVDYNNRHSKLSSVIPTTKEESLSNFGKDSSSAAKAASLGMTKKITLKIFIGKNIDKNKLDKLKQITEKDKDIIIQQVFNPKQTAFLMDKEKKAKNLRQSTDDTALIGYQSLAEELSEIENLTAVFIPTSSGTTAQGLYEGFKKRGLNPQIHIIQTPKCHPLVDDSPIGNSLANAIVDMIGYRKEAIQKILHETKGRGWIAADNDIIEAQKLVKEAENIDISPNGALGIAGLTLALKDGVTFNGSVVCLITGQ